MLALLMAIIVACMGSGKRAAQNRELYHNRAPHPAQASTPAAPVLNIGSLQPVQMDLFGT